MNSYLNQTKDLILDFLSQEAVSVYLFGSQARGNSSSMSDVDVAYLPKKGFDKNKISLLKDRLENSTIPYKIDLVDLNTCDDSFVTEIMEDAIIWKD